MSTLSEVTVLMGTRARDIEKAREIFTAEIRTFVRDVVTRIRLIRSDPWITARIRVDLPKEIDTEVKAASDFSSQYAIAKLGLRFKKGTKFMLIADVQMGIELDEVAEVFAWQATLVPASSYNRVDDVVWAEWMKRQPIPAGAAHLDRANTVRFFSRQLSPEVTGELAFHDAKAMLEFLLTLEAPLGEAVGLEE